MARMPAIFVSHESPQMWDTDSSARDFLRNLSGELPRPSALLIISAHWQEPQFTVSSAEKPTTVHDFGGFPQHYYQIQYPAPGSTDVAAQVLTAASQQNIVAIDDVEHGMDHAVWLAVGRATSHLRDRGVLIIGSGTATHNLSAFFGSTPPKIDAAPGNEASEFQAWLKENVSKPEVVLDYKNVAPYAAFSHKTPDHFMPLIVAMGTGNGDRARVIHDSFCYSHFAMTSFCWG